VNQVNGNHQTLVTGDSNKNALQALERAIPDSHTLSHGEIGVRPTLRFRPYQGTDSVDLLVWNWRCFFARTDKGDHPVGLKYAYTGLHGPGGAGKDIAREQWKLDEFATITPGPDLRAYWEESFDARGFQRVLHGLFVPWARLNGAPFSGQQGFTRCRIYVCEGVCLDCEHGFAILSPMGRINRKIRRSIGRSSQVRSVPWLTLLTLNVRL
jgi:hypothetical protein